MIAPETKASRENQVLTSVREVVRESQLRHVALIMDGNRRWAKKCRLPTAAGHAAGVEVLRRIVRHAGDLGLEALTVYAFSTENWNRGPEEVGALMALFVSALARELDRLHQNGVCLRFIGDLSVFSPELQDLMATATRKTVDNPGLKFQVALNYGGRKELVAACRHLIGEAQAGRLDPEALDETHVSNALYTCGLPDPDLLIRTGGEYRLSNYLLWQCAYAELAVSDVLWPDFSPETLDAILLAYARRERRFGQ